MSRYEGRKSFDYRYCDCFICQVGFVTWIYVSYKCDKVHRLFILNHRFSSRFFILETNVIIITRT